MLSLISSDLFGNGTLESIAANSKYIGFLLKKSDGLSYMIAPFEEFCVAPRKACEEKIVNFNTEGPFTERNHRA